MSTLHHPDIIAIGGSAGSIDGICRIMRHFPSDLSATVLVVTHRPAGMQSHLPQIIQRETGLATRIAREGDPLLHGCCFVSPPAYHLTVDPQSHIRLVGDGFHRGRGVDLLFHSLAANAGKRTIGVILSGMLADGSAGLAAIKAAGGVALVQSPTDAEFISMPRHALERDGPVDFVGPADLLAAEILRRVGAVPLARQLH